MSSDAEYEVADAYAGNEQLEDGEDDEEAFDVKAEHELGDLVDEDSEDDIEAPELSVDGDDDEADDEQMQQMVQTFKQDPDDEDDDDEPFDDQEEDEEMQNFRGQSADHQQPGDEEHMIGLESSNVSQMDDDDDEEEAGGQEEDGHDEDGEEAETLPVVTEDDVDENGVYKWKEFQGATVSVSVGPGPNFLRITSIFRE